MKRLLLLIVSFCSYVSLAQISFNGPQVFGPATGGDLVPILQGSSGTFVYNEYAVPQISGVLTSIDIDIDFTYSAGNTYASDLTFVISRNENVMDSSNNIIQLGGYDQLASVSLPWGCTGCPSSAVPIPMIAHLDFPAPIDFTDTNFILWMGNGYLNAAAIGTWSINNITFGGANQFVQLQDLAFDVNVYPNPVNGVLNVKSAEVLSKVEIYSIAGQKVLSTEPNNLQAEINLSELNRGTYICKLTSDNGQSTVVRFVKN